MSDSIRLDEKHGVNPGMSVCFLCQEPKDVLLWGKLKPNTREELIKCGANVGNDGRAPTNLVLDMEPCDKCKGHMAQGVILISVRDTDDPKEQKNPYRTGGWVVVTEDAIKRWVSKGAVLDNILKRRVSFMPDKIWDAIGLPREEAASGG